MRTERRRQTPRSAPLATRLLLAAVATSIALAVGSLLCEVTFRFVFDPVRVLDGDAMWEYRWRQSRAGPPGDGDLGSGYGFDRHDPDLGWSPRESFAAADVRTNSLGIRADREIPFERDPGVRRIVTLGDSFIWGEEVANGQEFAAVLDRRLENAEVINLGVHGYGTDQQLLRYRALGARFAPDLVLLGFYEEDLYRNALSFRDYAKPRFRVGGGALSLENVPVPAPRDILARDQALPRSFSLVVLRRFLRKASRSLGADLSRSEEWSVTRAILSATDRECRSHGARFALFFIPYGNFDEAGPVEPLLAAWARASDVPYLDLRERFLRLPTEDQQRLYRGHWTPFGNEVVAELIELFIEERGLLEQDAPLSGSSR